MSALTDQFAADLSDAFFNLDEFGESVTYTPVSGSPVSISIIFNGEFKAANPMEMDTITTQPVALARSADVPSAKKGDRITRSGTVFYVQHAEPDGLGATVLILSKKENL